MGFIIHSGSFISLGFIKSSDSFLRIGFLAFNAALHLLGFLQIIGALLHDVRFLSTHDSLDDIGLLLYNGTLKRWFTFTFPDSLLYNGFLCAFGALAIIGFL